MGGKSRSSQTQHSSNSQTSINNTGEYAGNSGTINHDESRHEYDIDASDNRSWDNSVEQDIDNSVANDGDFAGSTGNITILDGGAVESAFDFAGDALDSNNNAIDSAFDFGGKAIDANSEVSQSAIEAAEKAAEIARKSTESALENMAKSQKEAFGFGSQSLDTVRDVQESAINSMESAQSAFSEHLGETTGDFIQAFGQSNESMNNAVSQIMGETQQQNQEQLATVAELAKNTALAGQDIVAEQGGKMVKYMAFAFVGLGLAFFALKGAK